MPIESLGNGGTIFTGTATRVFQCAVVIAALKLEMKGIRMSKISAVPKACQLTGLKTRNKQALIDALEVKKAELARRDAEESK